MQLVKNENDSLTFKLATNQTSEKRIFLRLQIRGTVQSMATAILKDSLAIKMPVENSSRGIAEATVFDEQLHILAEKLVYLHADRKLKISISQVKERYAQKEKVTVKIKTTGTDGKAMPAVLSLRVYDRLFQNPVNSRDIGSYYLLSTQLRGNVYDPLYYFDSTHKDRKAVLNLFVPTGSSQPCY